MLLTDKVAVITGASSGIGAATARLFIEEGAFVVLADVQNELGQSLAEALGERAIYWHCDVREEESVKSLITQAVSRFGRLDCAVNNAGVTGDSQPLHKTSLQDWQRVQSVNLEGVFLCVKYQLTQMREQGGGAIVNVASGAGVIATPNMAPYCSSKHGVLGLTKTAATENVRKNIRVNAVLPGSVRTPMLEASMQMGEEVEKMILGSIPCGRLGEPAEVAQTIAWLCSDKASYVSGESIAVDGATICR